MAAGNLVRIPVVRNHKYKPHGLKSFVYMVNKYNIHPTKPGPYQRSEKDKPLTRKLADGAAGAVYVSILHCLSFEANVQIGLLMTSKMIPSILVLSNLAHHLKQSIWYG